MKKYTQEFKVGLFIVACLAGLAYLVLSTGKITFGKAGYNIYVVFDEVAGLNKKAPVMLDGFEVGKVEDVKISFDADKTLIMLTLRLGKDIKVREGSDISIKTLGLMGEKYIQISSSESPNFLKPETTLYGKPYADMDTLVTNFNAMMDQNKDSINSIVKNLDKTSQNMESFSEDIKDHPWKLLFKGKEKKGK